MYNEIICDKLAGVNGAGIGFGDVDTSVGSDLYGNEECEGAGDGKGAHLYVTMAEEVEMGKGISENRDIGWRIVMGMGVVMDLEESLGSLKGNKQLNNYDTCISL